MVGPSAAKNYTWHSARIGLACALLASGATPEHIQALCRWQTKDSLRTYARLEPKDYKRLLEAATRADVESVSTSALPAIDASMMMADIMGVSVQELSTVEAEPETA